MTQQLFAWLARQPGWERSGMDSLKAHSGATAVFPLGLRQKGRKTDILGTERIRTQARFRLAAQDLPAPPQLGDLPVFGSDQRAYIQDYRLVHRDKEGPGRYEGDLIIEFWEE